MKYLISLIIVLSTVSASYGATGSTVGGGGVTQAWNYTTSQYEMLPQCFPYVWASDYFVMNLASMYSNQEICRADRAFDFRF